MSDNSDSPKKQKKVSPKSASSDKAGFTALGSLFDSFQLEDKGGYITQEFQDYGYRLAVELDDLAHKSLYMRLSKNTDRNLLERALSFVSDASNAKSKAKLFMWKLQQLKKEHKSKKN